ncbi:MAG TPA: glycosyltransferase family 4 protein [Rhodothermales bacterium]|nr:glycosyltransferase family 4 protein [Rhodothermales bacterium]
MRVLHVVSDLKIGGITRFVEGMVALNDTSETRHDVLLGTSSPASAPVSQVVSRYGTVHFIDPRRGAFVKSLAAMRSLERRYDAVLIHTAFPAVVIPLMLSRKPCLVFQHGMMPGRRSRLSRRLRTWWYSLLPVVLNAKVVCSTTEAYQKMSGMGVRVRKSAVVIVPFGITLSPHRSAKIAPAYPGTLTVGMAGRLVKQKRHELVIRSLVGYDGAMPVRLLIAGEGSLRDELDQLAASAKSNVTVTFLGDVPDMNGFYEQIDLLLFPSRNESFGLVVPEAFDRCVPVAVFNDVGGCLSLIRDGENGFVMSDGFEGLAGLWKLLDRDRAVLQSMSCNLENADLSALSIEGTRDTLDRIVREMSR